MPCVQKESKFDFFLVITEIWPKNEVSGLRLISKWFDSAIVYVYGHKKGCSAQFDTIDST